MMEEEKPPEEYMSFNGLGRSPMIWGIPYMAGLFIICATLLPAMMLGTFIHGSGWLFALIALPLLLFAKSMCATDDKALLVLGKEVKWALIRVVSGNSGFYGGALTMSPISYGRKRLNVERAIASSVRG